MAESSKCVTARRIPRLFEVSKDGHLPEEIEQHVATCEDCKNALIAMVNKQVGLAPVSVKPEESRSPSEPAQNAYGTESSEVETVVQFGLTVDTERSLGPGCWSDFKIRRVATRPLGNSINTILFKHMSECERCSQLHISYRKAYLDIYGQWQEAFSPLWLSWVFNFLIRFQFIRFYLLSQELRRRS